jgi:hypothetical protein
VTGQGDILKRMSPHVPPYTRKYGWDILRDIL